MIDFIRFLEYNNFIKTRKQNMTHSAVHDCYILKIKDMFFAKRIEATRAKREARIFSLAYRCGNTG